MLSRCCCAQREPFSIQRELQAVATPEARVILEGRLAELNAVLTQTSPYALRDDSRLAYRCVTGEIPHWSVYGVAHEMSCQQYLCEHLPYQQTQQPYLRKLANSLKAKSGASWTAVWAAVRDLGPEILKLQLMHQRRIGFPDFQPPPMYQRETGHHSVGEQAVGRQHPDQDSAEAAMREPAPGAV